MKSLIKFFKKVPDYLNQFLLVGVVFAQEEIPVEPPAGWERLGEITLPQIVSTLIKLILVVAALIAFIFLVWGGIKWITSGGDKEGTAKAQSTITAALVGLVIVFASWAIIRLLEVFFGFQILSALRIPRIE